MRSQRGSSNLKTEKLGRFGLPRHENVFPRVALQLLSKAMDTKHGYRKHKIDIKALLQVRAARLFIP